MNLGWTWAFAVSAVVVGVLMLFWGRVLSRYFCALVGAVTGLAISSSLARQFGIDPILAGVLAAVIFAAAGAVTARLIWAMAGGSLCAAIGVLILLANSIHLIPAKDQPAVLTTEDFISIQTWFIACWNYVLACLTALWKEHSEKILWTLIFTGGATLAVLLLLPRFGKLFMTALVGALGIVAGLLTIAASLRQSIWPASWDGFVVYLLIAAALLMFSTAFQYVGEIRAEARAEKARKEKQAKEKGAKAGNGKKAD